MTHPEQQELGRVLQSEDELGAVIRAHILLENQLLKLLDLTIPAPEHLSRVRLSYQQRVDLALAMGLKKQLGPPLKKFGSIRNEFAHKPDIHLTDEHVNNFYGALAPEDREIMLTSYEKTRKKVSGAFEAQFKELEPKDKLILIVVSLHAALLSAVIQIEREPRSV